MDATLAQQAGSGFTKKGTDIYWKSWTAVTIPLQNYVGQTVAIRFSTRDCCPNCDAQEQGTGGGSHYAYAYIDASCIPSEIIPSAPSVCSGQNITLTAPVGAATYAWTGPVAGSIVSGGTTNVATVNQPGTYTVTMTTIGATPCTYALTATMPVNLPGSAVTVNSPSICDGASATLTASGGGPYLWSPGGATTTSITVLPAIGVSSYSVAGGTCPSTGVGTVTVNPIPTSPFTVTTVCVGVGSTITYTGNASSSDTYAWNFGGGTVISGSGQGPYSVSWPTSGTPNVTLTVTIGTCVSPLTANPVTVNPIPVVTINPSAVCGTPSGTLTAAGAATYVWSDASTSASLTASPSSSTSYTVTGTTAGCSATATGTINPTPTSLFTVTPVCVGAGSTITYTGNASASDTYAWNFAGGTVISGSGQGPYSVSWPVSGSPNVTLTVTAGTCVSPLTTVAVTVNPLPVVSITPATVCIGSSGTITAAGANTYVWSDASTGASLSDTPAATTPYTVTGTSAAGCTGTAVGTITVNPLQDPTFSYTPSTICKTGGSNPTPVIAIPGGTFTASPAGLVMNASTGVATLASSALGTYTITYTTAGPCPDASTFVINIVGIPVADFTLWEYCQNSINPSPTYINGGSAGIFTATAGLNFVSPVVTPGEVDLAGSASGNYTVTNTISSPGCPLTVFSNTIIINPVPITTVTNATVCAGVAATLTAGGASSYIWSDATTSNTLTASPGSTTPYTVTGTTAGCSSSAIGTITVNPIPVTTVTNATVCAGVSATLTAGGASAYVWSDATTSGTLTAAPGTTTPYTVTGTTLGCSSSAVGTITVNPIPIVTVNDPVICFGNSTNLTAVGATTYLWSDGTTVNPKTVSPASTASYTVTGTSLGCSSTDVSTITITLLPVVTVNSPAICAGQSATLTASGGSVYDWQTGQTANSITVSPLTTTTYTVGDNTPGCSGSAIATVIVNSLPVVSVNTPTICEGQSATLTAAGANTYAWSTGSTANPLIVSPVVPSSYTVIGTTAAGCRGTAVTTVSVNPLPVITVNSDSICEGLTTVLSASGATSYVWSNGAVTASVSVSPSSTTPYSVTGTSAAGCSSISIGTVTVFPKPGAAFSASPNPAGMFNPVVAFNNQSSADVNYWFWSFGDGDTLADNTKNPTHTYPGDTASYIATLIVHNAGFCYDTINHLILIGPEYAFYIPNAFTPDGDDINDTFSGKGIGILEYRLMIFDRWGNFIFTADDIDKGWDGKANGGSNVAQQDVYVWKVELTDIFHKKHNYVGTVTIVRGND